MDSKYQSFVNLAKTSELWNGYTPLITFGLNLVYVNDIIELKKKRKAAGLKMDALCAFGGMTPKASPNVQRRGSFK